MFRPFVEDQYKDLICQIPSDEVFLKSVKADKAKKTKAKRLKI
jgi:hypothetical protein